LKKPDFVRAFISVKIPGDERELYRSYKHFLKHYNVAYSGSSYDQTPIQRMLTMVSIDERVCRIHKRDAIQISMDQL
jgi:hypothetical protein